MAWFVCRGDTMLPCVSIVLGLDFIVILLFSYLCYSFY